MKTCRGNAQIWQMCATFLLASIFRTKYLASRATALLHGCPQHSSIRVSMLLLWPATESTIDDPMQS